MSRRKLSQYDDQRRFFRLLGWLLIFVSALAGAMLIRYASTTVPALAMSEPLDRGEVLTSGHLRVVEITPDPAVSWLPPEAQGQLVGRATSGPVGSGQLVTETMFVAGEHAIGSGQVLVAAAIGVGAVPSSVRPGDRVRLQLPASASQSPPGSALGAESIGEAVVWSVEPSVAGGFTLSLLVAEHLEPIVTAGSSSGRLRVNILGAAD